MRALYIHISGLVGLLVFLKEVLNYTPIERTILVAATTGLTVYLMLIVGHAIVMRIMAYSPPASTNRSAPAAPAPNAAANNGPLPNAASGASSPPSAAEPPAPPPGDAAAEDETATESNDAPDTNASAPDRAPTADRQESDASEPLAQTTA